jgi:succinate dehydrogenase / fumarate reductase flavoprotein subunit
VSGGMHGSNRLGGNSLSDLLVFGKRAGDGAADYLEALGDAKPAVAQADLDAAVAEALEPFSREAGESPYEVHAELQQTMNDLVGIIRRESEVRDALAALEKFKERAKNLAVPGERACWWPSAWRWRRSSARSRAAGTPARTTRPWSPSGARST